MFVSAFSRRRGAGSLAVISAAALATLLVPAAPRHATFNGRLVRSSFAVPVRLASNGNYAGDVEALDHWNHFPLTVAFAPDRDTTPQRESAIMAGFNQWVAATGSHVAYRVVSNPSHADVVVRCDTSLDHGVTDTNFDPRSHTISHADVRIGLADPDEGGKAVGIGDVKGLAAHEFGHALGINGHSRNAGDLMYPVLDDNRQVTVRDVNTLRLAYQSAI